MVTNDRDGTPFFHFPRVVTTSLYLLHTDDEDDDKKDPQSMIAIVIFVAFTAFELFAFTVLYR